jgi:hypothetical protein
MLDSNMSDSKELFHAVRDLGVGRSIKLTFRRDRLRVSRKPPQVFGLRVFA